MTKTDYEKLRAKIDDRYQQDLAALDRLWWMFRGDERPPAEEKPFVQSKPGEPKKKLSRSEAMKASWARRRAGKLNGDAKGLRPKNFSKFLVQGPISGGGNGDE
jgi:hypothetical protein